MICLCACVPSLRCNTICLQKSVTKFLPALESLQLRELVTIKWRFKHIAHDTLKIVSLLIFLFSYFNGVSNCRFLLTGTDWRWGQRCFFALKLEQQIYCTDTLLPVFSFFPLREMPYYYLRGRRKKSAFLC